MARLWRNPSTNLSLCLLQPHTHNNQENHEKLKSKPYCSFIRSLPRSYECSACGQRCSGTSANPRYSRSLLDLSQWIAASEDAIHSIWLDVRCDQSQSTNRS